MSKKREYLNDDSNWRLIDEIKVDEHDTLQVGDCAVEVADVDREVWTGIPKAQLITYYHNIFKFIQPHLIDRPQSLHVKYKGASAPGVYIKDMEGRQPEWAQIFHDKRKHAKAGKRSVIDYLVCNNEATLLWMVNLGCIDINPWTSRIQKPDQPDYITIDLDPSDGDFNKAIETARAAKQLLDEKKLTAFVKTSGKTGIHIYIPCSGFTFPEARHISEYLCACMHELGPVITTTNVSVNSRGSKLFIDPSQNDYADTLAAPYSVRPAPQPTVSTPLQWKEIKTGLDSKAFTIFTIEKRLNKVGDLWDKMLDKKTISRNNGVLKVLGP